MFGANGSVVRQRFERMYVSVLLYERTDKLTRRSLACHTPAVNAVHLLQYRTQPQSAHPSE